MIVLFTDFGIGSSYMGQMRAVLHMGAPKSTVVDLFADVPNYDIRAASYLLAAHVGEFSPGTIFLGVVDPGVGGNRPGMVLRADGHIFVGPGNGLFEIVARRATNMAAQRISWQPDHLAPSFHGRDLFAPVAAAYACGDSVAVADISDTDWRCPAWPDDLAQVIYLDHFGNAMTGLRAAGLKATQKLGIGGQELSRANTFGDVPTGQAFWYENANGLVEIAVNQGSAAQQLGLRLGSAVALI
ncbi:MAG: SAM-dependent chlorinase/fluorinase [Rhodospirillaceae bacterium]|nr:SAM-dependent chlorinase/fluorinase [Rhodospirillaceae bacterium]MBT4042502.1 SAM-dependent chlorinase/fluorinase [Rhodospirillaceae bacterium]MBT4691223.1 SAM-dependent chlorinase/fluorinase [Rhodospirillaceae bacterium]MBT5082510.1 SAM-dependent chlorinase/fluorinase [Rhodospirillaceae bacterium]MBT5525385.1 SAM-dependent chlorinase/fluorinase [Rhodospirillaceae bacterium]